MKSIRKILCVILSLAFIYTCVPLAYAANEEENPFSGAFAEYRHDDGSVTTVYDNGSVSTEYSDGTKEAVDYDGRRYSKDAEGTQTVYDIDGTVAKEYTDGTQEMINPDGTKETYLTDGSSVTEYRSGLCEKTYPDGTSAYYFEGGEGMLKNDGSGYENGTITGPNGEILSSGAKGIELIGKDGTKYGCTYSEEGSDTVNIERPDGTGFETFADGTGVYKIDGAEAKVDLDGNMYWTFKDGGSASFENGVMKITAADGSYQIKDSRSGYFETFNAQNGSHMVINGDGEVEELKLNAEGFKFDYSDGKLNLLQDDESGLTIVMNEDGSGKVVSADKSYELGKDGKYSGAKHKTQKPSENNTDKEGKWVEPYGYFGVKTSEELLPKLRSNGVTKLEVTPIVFDEKTGETRSLSNAEPFILDMADGAVTTFSTSFNHPMGESSSIGIDLTLTFTGGRGAWNGNYWSIDGVRDETWSNGEVDHEEFDDGILYDVNVDWFPEQFRQYIIMDVRIIDFLGFKVQRVLLEK